jgi:hypothetical protein
MHRSSSPPAIALVRAETRRERAARRAADAPLVTFLTIETFPASGAAVVRELDLPGNSRAAVAADLAAGQWENPRRIVFVDEAAGICRDASAEIAGLLNARPDLSSAAREFCARHTAKPRSTA